MTWNDELIIKGAADTFYGDVLNYKIIATFISLHTLCVYVTNKTS